MKVLLFFHLIAFIMKLQNRKKVWFSPEVTEHISWKRTWWNRKIKYKWGRSRETKDSARNYRSTESWTQTFLERLFSGLLHKQELSITAYLEVEKEGCLTEAAKRHRSLELEGTLRPLSGDAMIKLLMEMQISAATTKSKIHRGVLTSQDCRFLWNLRMNLLLTVTFAPFRPCPRRRARWSLSPSPTSTTCSPTSAVRARRRVKYQVTHLLTDSLVGWPFSCLSLLWSNRDRCVWSSDKMLMITLLLFPVGQSFFPPFCFFGCCH